jgi:hypothetical protein
MLVFGPDMVVRSPSSKNTDNFQNSLEGAMMLSRYRWPPLKPAELELPAGAPAATVRFKKPHIIAKNRGTGGLRCSLGGPGDGVLPGCDLISKIDFS